MRMKAAVQTEYGPPDVLEVRDVEKPVPGHDEVLIRIHASTVTHPDCAMRKADPFIVRFFAGLLKPRGNAILGDSLAGQVEAVGRGVTLFAPGDRVFGVTGGRGAHAEYVCLPQTAALVPKPASLDDPEAAGLAYGFLTAMPFLRDLAKVRPGRTLLVNGAAGSVGTVAVQIARHLGAEVTGVCSAANLDLVASLGAGRVIDYAEEDFTEADGAYDIVFDAVGRSTFARCRRALKPDGVYLTTVPSLAILLQMLWTSRRGGRKAIFAATGLRRPAEKIRDLHLLGELAEAGTIRPVIDRRYRLDEIAAAHAYVETGHKAGDVVVIPGGR